MKTKAFTLIELSIVLVIIGLIVGGILVGKDLIDAAQVRSQISQIESFSTAAGTFRLKYNCIAGDCANAESLGLGSSAQPGANGNGDGAITTANSSVYRFDGLTWKEPMNFWYHLSRAGFLDQNVTGYLNAMSDSAINAATPKGKLNSIRVMVSNMGTSIDASNNPMRIASNSFYLYDENYATIHGFARSGPKVLVAKQIDDKIDDGLPFTGSVACTNIVSAYVGIPIDPNTQPCGYSQAHSSQNCNTATQNAYQVNSFNDCQIAFLNKF